MLDHRSFAKSFGYALEGVHYALIYNQNLKIHFVVAAAVMLLSLILGISVFEFAVLVVMIILVISSEMINTAIEQMTDLITQEHRKEAKIAKDVSAGMVLVTSIGAAFVGSIILIPYILNILG